MKIKFKTMNQIKYTRNVLKKGIHEPVNVILCAFKPSKEEYDRLIDTNDAVFYIADVIALNYVKGVSIDELQYNLVNGGHDCVNSIVDSIRNIMNLFGGKLIIHDYDSNRVSYINDFINKHM